MKGRERERDRDMGREREREEESSHKLTCEKGSTFSKRASRARVTCVVSVFSIQPIAY